jgi:hypothetical protein
MTVQLAVVLDFGTFLLFLYCFYFTLVFYQLPNHNICL